MRTGGVDATSPVRIRGTALLLAATAGAFAGALRVRRARTELLERATPVVDDRKNSYAARRLTLEGRRHRTKELSHRTLILSCLIPTTYPRAGTHHEHRLNTMHTK